MQSNYARAPSIVEESIRSQWIGMWKWHAEGLDGSLDEILSQNLPLWIKRFEDAFPADIILQKECNEICTVYQNITLYLLQIGSTVKVAEGFLVSLMSSSANEGSSISTDIPSFLIDCASKLQLQEGWDGIWWWQYCLTNWMGLKSSTTSANSSTRLSTILCGLGQERMKLWGKRQVINLENTIPSELQTLIHILVAVCTQWPEQKNIMLKEWLDALYPILQKSIDGLNSTVVEHGILFVYGLATGTCKDAVTETYGNWFAAHFVSKRTFEPTSIWSTSLSSSLINSKKQVLFLTTFLLERIEECDIEMTRCHFKELRAYHTEYPNIIAPFLSRARVLCSATTTSVNGSAIIDTQKDIEGYISEFLKNPNRVPASVKQVRIFKKDYWNKAVLKTMVDPSLLSKCTVAELGQRTKFMQVLYVEKVVSDAYFQRFLDIVEETVDANPKSKTSSPAQRIEEFIHSVISFKKNDIGEFKIFLSESRKQLCANNTNEIEILDSLYYDFEAEGGGVVSTMWDSVSYMYFISSIVTIVMSVAPKLTVKESAAMVEKWTSNSINPATSSISPKAAIIAVILCQSCNFEFELLKGTFEALVTPMQQSRLDSFFFGIQTVLHCIKLSSIFNYPSSPGAVKFPAVVDEALFWCSQKRIEAASQSHSSSRSPIESLVQYSFNEITVMIKRSLINVNCTSSITLQLAFEFHYGSNELLKGTSNPGISVENPVEIVKQILHHARSCVSIPSCKPTVALVTLQQHLLQAESRAVQQKIYDETLTVLQEVTFRNQDSKMLQNILQILSAFKIVDPSSVWCLSSEFLKEALGNKELLSIDLTKEMCLEILKILSLLNDTSSYFAIEALLDIRGAIICLVLNWSWILESLKSDSQQNLLVIDPLSYLVDVLACTASELRLLKKTPPLTKVCNDSLIIILIKAAMTYWESSSPDTSTFPYVVVYQKTMFIMKTATNSATSPRSKMSLLLYCAEFWKKSHKAIFVAAAAGILEATGGINDKCGDGVPDLFFVETQKWHISKVKF